MASKPSDFSRWGSLTQLGLTEDDLLNIIVRREGGYTPPSYHDPPTYGTIFELHYYSNYIAGNVRRKPNRVLKCLLDTLFPSFSVSRADRLERRVILLNSKVESMSKEELDEYLQQKWIPQATGIYHIWLESIKILTLKKKNIYIIYIILYIRL